jgi:hypothetical protein
LSAVSQRTDDFVSGRSTATFWALPPESVVLLPPPLDESSSLPQPANTAPTIARALSAIAVLLM